MSDELISFWIVVDGELIQIEVEPSSSVSRVYDVVRDYSYLLKRQKPKDCRYYKLKTPVQGTSQMFQEKKVIEACMEINNWELLAQSAPIQSITENFQTDFVYIVMEILEDPREIALRELEDNQQELFTRLQINIRRLRRWSLEDVENNGGIYSYGPSEIEERLGMARVYESGTKSEDLEKARLYLTEFLRIFSPSKEDTPVTVMNDREFFAFYAVNRGFIEDAKRVNVGGISSSLVVTMFQSYFIHPPYFSCARHSRNIEYKEEMPWNFPIFIQPLHLDDAWQTLHPNSHWSVISPEFLCPFVISEANSYRQGEDIFRMELQAIVAARVGSYLLKAGSKKKFFVVGIYFTSDLVVERRIVTQVNPSKPGGKVMIHKKGFNLGVKEKAVDFLREMFNLVTLFEEIVDELDEGKRGELLKIHQVASKMQSVHSQGAWTPTSGSPRSSTPDRGWGSAYPEDDDLGVFDTPEVQSVLEEMNYEVSFVAFGHLHIGAVVDKDEQCGVGYIKFVEDWSNEVKILKYLGQFKSPQNHTIHPTRIWSITGGTVILMPIAGGRLSSLEDPNSHLWEVAQQICEAVGFLHEHNVAHMDLKPANLIIPKNYGRLTLIDFHLSIRVKRAEQMITGYVGTPGYIAPEVGKRRFSPIKADLWSCGKVLQELCKACEASTTRDRLLEITSPLLDRDPEKRPTMSRVLEQMSEFASERSSKSLSDSS